MNQTEKIWSPTPLDYNAPQGVRPHGHSDYRTHATLSQKKLKNAHPSICLIWLMVLCWTMPVQAAETDPALSARDVLFVNEYRIEGNTVLDQAEIQGVTAAFRDREVTSQELLLLRERLTLLYVTAGYINSGFVIPEQSIDGGVVRLAAVEGVVDGIEIDGLDRLPHSFIQQRLDINARPFNMMALQQQLQLLLLDPRIEKVNAELQPGIAPGHAWLVVSVTEARPWDVSFRLDNHRPPSIGSTELRIRVDAYNLTGHADELLYDLGLTDGLTDLVVGYTLPVASRTRVGAIFQANNATVVEEPFDQIEIISLTNDLGINAAYDIVHTLSQRITLSALMQKRHAESELLGIPFSFAPGVVDGESDVSALRIQGDWQRGGELQALAAQLQLSHGLQIFDATENPGPLPDSDFTSLLGQFQYIRRLPQTAGEMRIRAAGQLAFDPLLPIEKFVLGGAETVRGYRQNQLVRDNGWFWSVEMRFPLLRRYGLKWAAFADYGRAWNDQPFRIPGNKTLNSMGLGLIWDGRPDWHAQLYWGHPFADVPDPPDHDLQDEGITFLIRYVP